MPELHWIGKEKVVKYAEKVSLHVLEHKYNFGDETQNKIIHGDNLLALKSLLPEYEGKIKCIYIDPPYNTGNENWIYNDNVKSPQIKKWLNQVVGKEGEDLSRHDKWLCMMYPRLKLLQKLLADDGVIFISIDDNEQANLKLICDDIFGYQNFVDKITVIVKTEGRQYGFFAKTHENLFVFAKKIETLTMNEIEIEGKEYDYFDERGGFFLKGLRNRNVRAFNSSNRPNLRYPFYVDVNNPDKNSLYRVSIVPRENFLEIWAQTVNGLESVWRWGKEKSQLQSDDLCAYRGKDGVIRIFQKERKLTGIPKTVWFDKNFNSIVGTREIKEIFGKATFDFPKPLNFIQHILKIATDKDSIILDSFAGSGTTAHAVLKLNSEDDGNRKFILVEMEDYAEKITAERVRRVIQGYGEIEGTGGSFGFYEVGEPLMIDGNLNERVDVEKIRAYIWYSETHTKYKKPSGNNSAYLGEYNGTGIYFYYEKNNLTTLDDEFLRSIKIKAESYLIYADECGLGEDFLHRNFITFKKIPRDIKKMWSDEQ